MYIHFVNFLQQIEMHLSHLTSLAHSRHHRRQKPMPLKERKAVHWLRERKYLRINRKKMIAHHHTELV
jgi:hypothetical protein